MTNQNSGIYKIIFPKKGGRSNAFVQCDGRTVAKIETNSCKPRNIFNLKKHSFLDFFKTALNGEPVGIITFTLKPEQLGFFVSEDASGFKAGKTGDVWAFSVKPTGKTDFFQVAAALKKALVRVGIEEKKDIYIDIGKRSQGPAGRVRCLHENCL